MVSKQRTNSFAAGRLKCVRARMRELGLDAVITLDSHNQRWMSGWQEVFDDESAHLALITLNNAYIYTDPRYSTAMHQKNEKDLWRVSCAAGNPFACAQKTLAKMRKQELKAGYESSVRLDLFKRLKKEVASAGVKLVETKGLFAELRALKDEEELKLLRKAQSITDAAFTELLGWIAPGMKELEVANRLDFAMRQRGAEGVAFDTIAASGPNAALPHARPGARRLRKGDFLVLDFGARYRDYCADMTRTLVIGEASEKQRKIYTAVLDAHTQAKRGISAGVTGKEAHMLAASVLESHGYAKEFTHALGHGVGIAVHEMPNLAPSNTQPLVAGNVVTVEPGVYIAGYGGVRIEDCGAVGQTGFKSFARSPRELIEII